MFLSLKSISMSVAVLVLFTAVGIGVPTARAADWYAAPNGVSSNPGTLTSPWDLSSALAGVHPVAPGDTIWIRGGDYRHPYANVDVGYPVQLVGSAAALVQVRGYPGEHVTIDGGLNVVAPSSFLSIQDLELLVSYPRPPVPIPTVSGYTNLNRPWGGLTINTGANCRYVDLVVHDNCQGIEFWTPATDSEIYGCSIYDNGWQGTDRGHGHAIYTQNNTGTKTISDCLMSGGYGYTMHAYGSPASTVKNYTLVGNIAYNAGTFLAGGESPASNMSLFNNYLYNVAPDGFFASMQIGYLEFPVSYQNVNCDVENNIVDNGNLSIYNFKTVTTNNNLVLSSGSARPSGEQVFLRPNQYDPGRANLAIYDWDHAAAVAVDASSFLHSGDRYRLMDPRNLYGLPLQTGIYGGGTISIPMASEFAAYVLLRETVTDAPSDLTATAVSSSQINLWWANNAGSPLGIQHRAFHRWRRVYIPYFRRPCDHQLLRHRLGSGLHLLLPG